MPLFHLFPSHRAKAALLLSLPLLLSSCGISASKGDDISYVSQVFYGETLSYGYRLVDDKAKGKAIYPDEAYIRLREIEAHNKEFGLPFPEKQYSSASMRSLIGGQIPSDYIKEEETYVPGSYYFFESSFTGLNQTAEGYFFHDGEFFHGFYDNRAGKDDYYALSSVEEMKNQEKEFCVHKHYADFLSISDHIAKNAIGLVSDPQEVSCYANGEGSLYINIVRTVSSLNVDTRYIYRIVYEEYRPVFAVMQRVDNIFGDLDYLHDSFYVKFSYEDLELEPEEFLLDRFRERRDQQ